MSEKERPGPAEAHGPDEQYVVTFDGLRHHVRRRSDWQVVARDLSEEDATDERIRREYGGWQNYPPTRRSGSGLIRSLLLDYARARLRDLTEKDEGRCPHCGVPATPDAVCPYCKDGTDTPF